MATASTLAQLMVQRSANVRRTAQFSVSELFGLLDPMDLITVPLRDGGNRLVRIVEANEQSDGSIQLQVEEMLVGAAHAAEYTRQDALGIASDFNVSPGDANPPAIINPPLSLTNGANEVWIMASGGPQWGGAVVWASFDGDTYQTVGTITAPGRYGVTTSDFPVSSDPDTTQTLGVSLVESGAALTAGTDADADNQVTLCAVGTEIIAYSSAVLTGASTYNLGTYIRRGLEGTTIADQPAGSLFMRLDGSQVAIPYTQGQIGKTVYVKLQSFNLYGGAYEDLDLCTAYEFIAEPNGANVVDVTWASLTGIPSLLTNYVSSGGTSVSTGNVPGGATFGGGSTTAAQVLTASEAATNNIAIQTGQISALTTEIGTANTNISNLTATYGDTESAAASAAAAAGYSYASSLAANTAATYESGAYSYQQGASNYSTDAGNYATDAYNQFIAAEAQAAAANTSAGEASGYSASAGNSAAAAQQSASISASVGLGTYTKSPTFADDANPTGVPTNWTDWSNGAANCTRVSGLNSPYAVQFESYGQPYGFYQSFSGLTAGSWVVLEAQISIPYGGPSGSGFAGAGVLLNVYSNGDYVGTYVLSFYSDPDITNAVNNEGVGDGRVYTFSKLIQVLPGATGALTGQLYAMSKFSGLPGAIVDEEVVHIWYRCDIRPAYEGEIQGGQAYVTANETLSSFNSFVGAQDSTNTSLISQVDSLNAAVFDGSSGTLQSQITDLNAAQASQTSSFAQSIDTLTAQLQTGVNLVQNPDFQLGLTIGWTCISGSYVFDNPPYLGMIWNPGPAGTQSYTIENVAVSAPFDVAAGQPYSVQALFYSGGIGAATTSQLLIVQWLDAEQAFISSSYPFEVNTQQAWSHQKCDETTGGALVAPANAAYAKLFCCIASSSGDVVTTGDNLVWGQIQVEQSSYCTPYKNSLLTATVQQNSAAIATVEGALYGSYTLQVEAGNVVTGLQVLSESGPETISDIIFQAENFLIKSSSASSAATPFAYNAETGVLTLQDVVVSELSALSADLGTITAGYLSNEADTTFLDLDNGRSQYQVPGAAYALRMGTLGSGVTLWYGLASIAIGSETATNGVWSFGTNGVVYYGATALSTGASAFQKGAAGSLGAPTGAYAGGINAAFAAIPSSGYFNVSATLTPPGAGNPYNSGTAGQSGNWQIVATSSGRSQVLASGTWRSTAYVSGEGASITMDGAGVTNSTLCTLTGAVTVTFELQTTSSVGSSWQGTLNAQWIAQG
jgi:hypothetical protein